jgi:hypothetical protein
MKYRKKPAIVHAIQWEGTNLEEVNEFLKEKDIKHEEETNTIIIKYLDEEEKINVGDYIVKDSDEEIFSCKCEKFEGSYDLVEEPTIKKRKKHIIKG